LINEFADFNLKRAQITSGIIVDQENNIDNLKLTLKPIILEPSILPDGTNFQILINKASDKQNKLELEVEIFIGTEYKDKASFLKKINFPEFQDEEKFNLQLIELFNQEIILNSAQEKLNIGIKNPIKSRAAFIDSIKARDGFYFNDNVIVGFQEIMNKPEYK
jgi:hypothetical protein